MDGFLRRHVLEDHAAEADDRKHFLGAAELPFRQRPKGFAVRQLLLGGQISGTEARDSRDPRVAWLFLLAPSGSLYDRTEMPINPCVAATGRWADHRPTGPVFSPRQFVGVSPAQRLRHSIGPIADRLSRRPTAHRRPTARPSALRSLRAWMMTSRSKQPRHHAAAYPEPRRHGHDRSRPADRAADGATSSRYSNDSGPTAALTTAFSRRRPCSTARAARSSTWIGRIR